VLRLGVIVASVFAIGWVGGAFGVQSTLQSRLAPMLGEARVPFPSGFPGGYTLALPPLLVPLGAEGRSLTLRGVTLDWEILAPRHVAVTLAEGAELALPDPLRHWRIVAAGGAGRATLADLSAQRLRLSLSARGLRAEPEAGTGDGARIGMISLELDWPARALADGASLSLAMEDVRLDGALAPPLGGHVAWLLAEARWRGVLPQAREGGLLGAVTAWRDGGGSVALDRIALRWDPLDLDTVGEVLLAPDSGLQGNLAGRIDGYALAARRLVAAGRIPESEAAIAANTAVFAAPGRMELALTWKDGSLVLGTLPLLDLRPPPEGAALPFADAPH